MRQIFKYTFILLGGIFILPFIVVYLSGYNFGEVLNEIKSEEREEEQGLINKDVLIGVLAKEIPYTYETEAIKAQAVVIRSYMARRILGIQNKGQLIGYTKEEMQNKWGEYYETIYKSYERAVQETQEEMLFYKDMPIEALYHVASAGHTRDAQSVYNIEVPYLKGVASPQDCIVKEIKLSKKEIERKLKEKYSELNFSEGDLKDQIQIIQKDSAGYILNIQIANMTISGEEFRGILELPSSHFKIYDRKEDFIFEVEGIGSGVGMSQNGANELAKQGKSYKEIVEYYYTGIELKKYEALK